MSDQLKHSWPNSFSGSERRTGPFTAPFLILSKVLYVIIPQTWEQYTTCFTYFCGQLRLIWHSSENPVTKVITPARKLLLSEMQIHGMKQNEAKWLLRCLLGRAWWC